jgi:hypothetical protein
MIQTVCIVALLTVIALLIAVLVFFLIRSETERERLYNRLQAGTLHDYAQHKQMVEDKPKPKPVEVPYAPASEVGTVDFETSQELTQKAVSSWHRLGG